MSTNKSVSTLAFHRKLKQNIHLFTWWIQNHSIRESQKAYLILQCCTVSYFVQYKRVMYLWKNSTLRTEASCFSRGLKEIPLYQLSCMQIRFKKRKIWMGTESKETLQSTTQMKCKGKHTFVCVKVTASCLTLKRLTRKHLLL